MAAKVRKLVVEVVEARNLLPKDGTGTSSPYARADFDGQHRKTRTVPRDLNPVWNEPLEFNFPGPGYGGIDPVAGEPLEVAIFHDVLVAPTRRNNFLGSIRLDARQFVRKGDETLIYFPLEKKSFFSWVRGDIGLKVYYLDEPLAPEPDPPAAADEEPPKVDAPPPAPDASPVCADADPPRVQTEAEVPETAQGAPPPSDEASTEKPPEGDAEDAVPASYGQASDRPPEEKTPPPPLIPTLEEEEEILPPPPPPPEEENNPMRLPSTVCCMAATVRKLVVEVVEARDLQPKDGTGTSSPYARADFDGQHRKTRTVPRDLNPVWNERLEFNFPGHGPGGIDPVAGEPLEVAIFQDVQVGPSRRNIFLGRVLLGARQFVRKGEEALIYFPLEKKSFFSRVRGDIGLKVYYLDEPLAPEPDPPAAHAEPRKVDAPPPAPDSVYKT